jgi:hypothetical protein
MNATTKTNRTTEGEYRVRLFIDGIHQAGADYFATDKAEANATAALMIQRACQSDKTTDFAKAEAADYAEENPTAALESAWLQLRADNAALSKATRKGNLPLVRTLHKSALVSYRAFWAIEGASEFASQKLN